MRATVAAKNFSHWLSGELERQGVSRRELARRLSAMRPEDGDRFTEAQRRNLRRILQGQKANQASRNAICDALGVPRDSAPSVDDEDEEEEQDLAAALQAIAREQNELNKKISRALRAIA